MFSFCLPALHFFVYHGVALNLFSCPIVFVYCWFIDYVFYYLSFFLLSLSLYRWFPLFLSPSPVRNFNSRYVPLQSSIDAYTFPSLLPPASTLLAGTKLLRLFTAYTLHYINPVLGLLSFFLILDARSLDRQVVPICRWGIATTRCVITQKYTFLKKNIVWLCLETQKCITVYSAIKIWVVIVWDKTQFILVRGYWCYGRIDLIFTRTDDYAMSLAKSPSGRMMMTF